MRGVGNFFETKLLQGRRQHKAVKLEAGSDIWTEDPVGRGPKAVYLTFQKPCIDRIGWLPYPTSTPKASTDTKHYMFSLTSLD